jgi:hypothetical protein
VSYTIINAERQHETVDGPITEDTIIGMEMYSTVLCHGYFKAFRVHGGAIYYTYPANLSGGFATEGVFVPFKSSCKCQG